MAGQKQHDYHIVNPSPWPFLAALGAFAMLFGAVMWFRPWEGAPEWVGGPYLFLAGFVFICYVAFSWWSDVVKEAHGGDHTKVVQIGLRYGVVLFIISEVMFFVAWFWMYFKHAIFPMQSDAAYPQGGLYPPEGIQIVSPWELPLLNTLVLLSSGFAVNWAHHALLEGDRRGLVNGLALAAVLGVLFTALQAYEYYEIFSLGWFDGDNVYRGAFFMATGFHGLHVLIGTIFLFVCLLRSMNGHFDADNHIGFEAAAWYWHFVDVVWLFLFVGVYITTVTGI